MNSVPNQYKQWLSPTAQVSHATLYSNILAMDVMGMSSLVQLKLHLKGDNPIYECTQPVISIDITLFEQITLFLNGHVVELQRQMAQFNGRFNGNIHSNASNFNKSILQFFKLQAFSTFQHGRCVKTLSGLQHQFNSLKHLFSQLSTLKKSLVFQPTQFVPYLRMQSYRKSPVQSWMFLLM
jgi:hypothetical protein